jgi:hypothetical protein
MKILLTTALTGAVFLLSTAKASALDLYNGSIGTAPNNRPANQGWTYVPKNPFLITGSSTQTSDAAGTTFSSISNNNIESGYGWTATPLNASTGYNLQFNLQLLQEFRNASNDPINPTDLNGDGKDDRSGLSIIVVSTNTTKAIELGFFGNRIWAQEGGASRPPRFTQAEGAAFDTKTNVNQYDLSILGNNYFLYANGNYTTPLLTGLLRDYTAEVVPINPYRTPNTIFIGDNTTAASAQFRLNQVAYSSSAIVPVPFAFNPLFGFGLFGISRIRKALKARQSAN